MQLYATKPSKVICIVFVLRNRVLINVSPQGRAVGEIDYPRLSALNFIIRVFHCDIYCIYTLKL